MNKQVESIARSSVKIVDAYCGIRPDDPSGAAKSTAERPAFDVAGLKSSA